MKVYLVGAGPGDPDLLTLKGLECIKKAEVLVYDRLVNPELLKYVKPDCELIYVGKRPGHHTLKQEEINQLLVDKAKEKGIVTRLKGGDPFVFGRGGEEAEKLLTEGVPFEIVPGISSSIAAPAYAGIPVTHRNVATSFAVITGHEDPAKGESTIRWQYLSQAVDTLIFLMGVGTLTNTVSKLLQYGRAKDTPIALVRWGTTQKQQTLLGTLENIERLVAESGFTSPAVTIVGEVVKLREKLQWFEQQPLFGKHCLVTRARAQASDLTEKLVALGAKVTEFPLIELTDPISYAVLDKALENLADFQWLIFTSINGVERFFDRLLLKGRDVRDLQGIKLAAIGPATAKALTDRGLLINFVPSEYRAEAVAEGLKERHVSGQRILLARAEVARDFLPDELRKMGAEVIVAPVYRTIRPVFDAMLINNLEPVDYVTFTSSSTVKNFKDLWQAKPEIFQKARMAAIGPITAATAEKEGLKVDICAAEYTIEGLINAILKGE